MGIIELCNISKKYGEKVVFKDFNLSVQKGDFISIIGKSGSGKSTLLNIIGIIEKPDSGSTCICGIENPSIDSRKGRILLRNHISYLFQNYGLIEDRSVEYNIRLVERLRKHSKSMQGLPNIGEALERVGLNGFERKKIYQLSGGEQQRVAIAKILVKPTDIILADEPTGSLDPINRDLILSLLMELNKTGKTVLMVTHDENATKFSNKVKTL